jgi:hypothetical protein
MRLATLLTVVALAATACGSDKSSSSSSDTSAADWANGVCTAVTTYTQSVTDAATSLKGNVSKDGIDEATKQIQSATETFEDDVKGLGKPETNAGDQAKTTLDTLSDQLSTDLDKAKSATDQGFVQGLSTVTAALATAQTQLKTAFDQLQSLDAKGELSDAFNSATSCASLR